MQNSGYFVRFWKYAAAAAGVSAGLFAFFGMVVGSGPFMRIFSILLLAGQGWFLISRVRRQSPPQAVVPPVGPLEVSGLAAPIAPPAAALVEPLSKRELEVLQCIADGLPNQEIAERLIVAPSTVKTHINNIFSKLGVESRTQAVKRARELDLL
jgi:DNA-binding NarL/FixJ family response regulator